MRMRGCVSCEGPLKWWLTVLLPSLEAVPCLPSSELEEAARFLDVFPPGASSSVVILKVGTARHHGEALKKRRGREGEINRREEGGGDGRRKDKGERIEKERPFPPGAGL